MDKKSIIVGMPLLAIKEGRECGKITQLIVDADAKRVTHLVLGNSKGLLGFHMAVPVEKIVGVGRDFLTTETEANLIPVWTLGEGLGRCMADTELVGLTVISSQGNIEGKVSDFAFAMNDGDLMEYYLEEGPAIEKACVVTIAPQGLFVNFNRESVEVADARPAAQPQILTQPVTAVPAAEAPTAPVPEPIPAPVPEPEPLLEPVAEVPVVTEEPEEEEDDAPVELVEDTAEEDTDYFVRRQSEFLLGRTATKDILDGEGNVLIVAGQKVNAGLLKKVRAAGKLTELSLNV